LISVVVPALNEARYIGRCLKSLVNQTSSDREIIVVDGGSTDGTAEIAERYADIVISKPIRPIGAARNEGARAAKSDIVAFMDADTVASPNWLKAAEQRLRDDSSAAGVFGPTYALGGNSIDYFFYNWSVDIQRHFLSVGIPLVAGFNCAYRRKLFFEAGGFEATRVITEDMLLSLRIVKNGGRILMDDGMVAYTSPRRARDYGYPRIILMYVINDLLILLTGKSLVRYPPIR